MRAMFFPVFAILVLHSAAAPKYQSSLHLPNFEKLEQSINCKQTDANPCKCWPGYIASQDARKQRGVLGKTLELGGLKSYSNVLTKHKGKASMETFLKALYVQLDYMSYAVEEVDSIDGRLSFLNGRPRNLQTFVVLEAEKQALNAIFYMQKAHKSPCVGEAAPSKCEEYCFVKHASTACVPAADTNYYLLRGTEEFYSFSLHAHAMYQLMLSHAKLIRGTPRMSEYASSPVTDNPCFFDASLERKPDTEGRLKFARHKEAISNPKWWEWNAEGGQRVLAHKQVPEHYNRKRATDLTWNYGSVVANRGPGAHKAQIEAHNGKSKVSSSFV